MFANVGERVFAIESADAKSVTLLGFGVYVGDEVPPQPFGIMGMGCATWEELDAWVARENLVPEEMRPVRIKNPKIKLDDGRVVWGYECWWGTEDRYEGLIRGRVVTVPLCNFHYEHDAATDTPTGRRCTNRATHVILWEDGERYSLGCAEHLEIDASATVKPLTIVDARRA